MTSLVQTGNAATFVLFIYLHIYGDIGGVGQFSIHPKTLDSEYKYPEN